jgi:amino acid transporter
MIAFYYGFTGIACVVYFRKRLFRSFREFFLVGLCPLAGALMLAGLFLKAVHDSGQSGVNYSPPLLGIQVPLWIGVGGILLGIVVMLFVIPSYRPFFRRKPELPGPDGCTVTPEDEAAAAGAHTVP